MATPTFFHSELSKQDTEIELSALESAHAIKSRRLREGSAVHITNGRGLLATASLIIADARAVKVQIDNCSVVPRPKMVSIATAIPKGDRQRTMVDMLTQLGVNKIVPLNCERSVTRFKSSMLDKWQRWAIEACKQSQNPWLPEIHSALSIEEVAALPDFRVAYADACGQSLGSHEQINSQGNQTELLILVGPEGGFSELEHACLKATNCNAISLGRTILRTELACVTALAQAFMKDN